MLQYGLKFTLIFSFIFKICELIGQFFSKDFVFDFDFEFINYDRLAYPWRCLFQIEGLSLINKLYPWYFYFLFIFVRWIYSKIYLAVPYFGSIETTSHSPSTFPFSLIEKKRMRTNKWCSRNQAPSRNKDSQK